MVLFFVLSHFNPFLAHHFPPMVPSTAHQWSQRLSTRCRAEGGTSRASRPSYHAGAVGFFGRQWLTPGGRYHWLSLNIIDISRLLVAEGRICRFYPWFTPAIVFFDQESCRYFPFIHRLITKKLRNFSCKKRQLIPSGKHTKNYGKLFFFHRTTHYKWPFSIAMLVYQR